MAGSRSRLSFCAFLSVACAAIAEWGCALWEGFWATGFRATGFRATAQGVRSIRSAIEIVGVILILWCRDIWTSFENLTATIRDSKYNHGALANYCDGPQRGAICQFVRNVIQTSMLMKRNSRKVKLFPALSAAQTLKSLPRARLS